MTERWFWIEPGRLLAGPYPGAAAEVDALRELGVASFVDLTEEGELEPYSVPDGMRHVRMPIEDFGCASEEQMSATLDVIDEALGLGAVFVHCRGGCGRTGTVVACWLVRHGVAPPDSLERYAEASAVVCGRPCPETPAQRDLVLAWKPGR